MRLWSKKKKCNCEILWKFVCCSGKIKNVMYNMWGLLKRFTKKFPFIHRLYVLQFLQSLSVSLLGFYSVLVWWWHWKSFFPSFDAKKSRRMWNHNFLRDLSCEASLGMERIVWNANVTPVVVYNLNNGPSAPVPVFVLLPDNKMSSQ